jgi:hypothetical protein
MLPAGKFVKPAYQNCKSLNIVSYMVAGLIEGLKKSVNLLLIGNRRTICNQRFIGIKRKSVMQQKHFSRILDNLI